MVIPIPAVARLSSLRPFDACISALFFFMLNFQFSSRWCMAMAPKFCCRATAAWSPSSAGIGSGRLYRCTWRSNGEYVRSGVCVCFLSCAFWFEGKRDGRGGTCCTFSEATRLRSSISHPLWLMQWLRSSCQ